MAFMRLPARPLVLLILYSVMSNYNVDGLGNV